MAEKLDFYKDRTYKLLRGLSKSDSATSEIDQLQVPERKNRVILPKYGQTIRTHCPKGGEIMKKKLTKFDILWLEYEEEDLDYDEDPSITNKAAKSEFTMNGNVDDKICKYPEISSTLVEHDYMNAENTFKYGNLAWHKFTFHHFPPTCNLILENISKLVKLILANAEMNTWQYLIQDYRGVEIYDEKDLLDIEAEQFRILNKLLEIVTTDTDVSVIDSGEQGDDVQSANCVMKEYNDNTTVIVSEVTGTLCLKDDTAFTEGLGQHTVDTNTIEHYSNTDVIGNSSIVASDSEMEAVAEEIDEASVVYNDTLDGKSNATDNDVGSFSDLISETGDDICNGDDNVITDEARHEEEEKTQAGGLDESEDEEGFMYGILGVYSRG